MTARGAVHFVGFRDDRYWSAVRVWGRPDFVHRGFDARMRRELAAGDTIVFADLSDPALPQWPSFDDIKEEQP